MRFSLLAALFVVVAVVVGCALALAPGVTVMNFHRLQLGMTPEQVDEILGGENVYALDFDFQTPFRWIQSIHYHELGGDVAITVSFAGGFLGDKHERLVDKSFKRVPQTLGNRLRDRLTRVRRRLGL